MKLNHYAVITTFRSGQLKNIHSENSPLQTQGWSTIKRCILDCKHSDYNVMKALKERLTSPDNNTRKTSPGIRYCRCNQEKTCIRLLERKIWRRNGTAWACMASKETGSLNEVTADGKSSRSSEVYRAALSVRKILQNQQDDASFGDKVPESYPRGSKGE